MFIRRAKQNPKNDKSELLQNLYIGNYEELVDYCEEYIDEEEIKNNLINATANRFFKEGIVCAEYIESSEINDLESILKREFGVGYCDATGFSLWIFEGEILSDLPDGYIVRVTSEPVKVYEYK